MHTRFMAKRYIALARIFIASFGCAGVGWGLVNLPNFGRQASMEYVARHIIRGESYKIEALKQLIPVMEAAENAAICRPAALWSAAIVRLRMFEESEKSSQQIKLLDHSMRLSLSCSPAEPFLWLALYSAESAQNGFKPEYLKYLRMSYQLGPNEGWIILKRNSIALRDFDWLPADLAADAINEFVALLNNELYSQAVDIFSGAAWWVQQAIVPHLADLPQRIRESFARAIYEKGLDIIIPGVSPPSSKPRWSNGFMEPHEGVGGARTVPVRVTLD